jgi:hypothetical protein
MGLLPNGLILQKLLSFGEKTDFFILGMRSQEFMPSQTISNEVGPVGFCDMWCLMIDRIVSPENRIMHHTHVARAAREHVVLARNDKSSRYSS